MADELPDAPWASTTASTPAASSLPDAPWATKGGPDTLTSMGLGTLNAMSFGTAPAVAGLSEVGGTARPGSEIRADPEGMTIGDFVSPFIGAYRKLHDWVTNTDDPEVAASYERGRKHAAAQQKIAQEQHPAAYLTGQVAGVLGGPGFGAGQILGRGMGAGEVLGRIGQGMKAGAIGGGLYGAGEALGEGEGLGGIAASGIQGGVTGGLLGGIGSGVLEAARPLGTKIANVFRGALKPDDEAARQIMQAMIRDYRREGRQFTPEELKAAHDAGLPIKMIDEGGAETHALGERSSLLSEPARDALTKMTQQRFETQSPRIADFIRQLTGVRSATDLLEAVQKVAPRVNKPAYERAYADGAHGIWDEGFGHMLTAPVMQDAIRKTMISARNDAAKMGLAPPKNPFVVDPATGQIKLGVDKDGNTLIPNLQFWDYVKRNLDKVNTRDAQDWARILRERLDDLVPSYGVARAGAASFFGAQNALEAGHKFFDFTAAKTPAQQLALRQAYAKFTPDEKALFASGYASRLADEVERVPATTDVLKRNFVNSGPARDRTRMALGANNADQLEALLRSERLVDRARTMLGGSPTARRAVQLGIWGVGGAGAEALFEQAHGLRTPSWESMFHWGLLAGMGRRGAQAIDQRVATRIGQMLADDNPVVRQQGAQVIARNPVIFNALRQATSVGARTGTEAAHPGRPRIEVTKPAGAPATQ
jgi:hypothetical protein